MEIKNIVTLLGGLALFLYGMNMMSINLEGIAGNKLKSILEKLTANRFLGVFVGAGITALIQSSSATTVMVVSFVNSGIMTLQQTVWIIMGANIGTTITGQLIALDIRLIAPLIAFVGVLLIMFSKSSKLNFIGGIIAGLGILFIGMGMMSDSMLPLRDSPQFVSLMTSFKNPLLGILAGALFTAVIQSSSASIGILQALALSGVIGLDSAIYVLFGQNIGTCITAVIASIGANRNAKRTTIIHLLFNIIGTIIFASFCVVTPFVSFMQSLTPDNPAAQIANVHTIFNISTTLILLPFGTYLAKLAVLILPDKKSAVVEDEDHWLDEIMNTNYVLGTSILAIHHIGHEIAEMYTLVLQNVEMCFNQLVTYNEQEFEQIKEVEQQIDKLNYKVAKIISKVLALEQSYKEVKVLNDFFRALTNLERIGDHAMNMAEYAQLINQNKWTLSVEMIEEINQMKRDCLKGLEIFKRDISRDELLVKASSIEQIIDDSTTKYRSNQIQRMNTQSCQIELVILYSELLADYERIGDHVLNLAELHLNLQDLKLD